MSDLNERDEELAKLFAKMFIARKDVKALQVRDGGYRPIREPWKMRDLRDHIAKTKTFGHYTNDPDGMTKLITFDIDLQKAGTWVQEPADLWDVQSAEELIEKSIIHENVNPRELWRTRDRASRPWFKQLLRRATDTIAGASFSFGYKTAAAYTGNKGTHVYTFFDDPVHISEARQMALMILETAGNTLSPIGFEAVKGKNFFSLLHPDDPWTDMSSLNIEIYPKQDTMDDKDFGNLVRLPLGVNHHGPVIKGNHEPTFFVDQRCAQTELKPHPDPVALLTEGNPFTGEPS